MRPQRLVLIGPNQQENLALQYLAAAATSAGHQAELVAYNGRNDLRTAVQAALGRDPDVIGLGIAFQYAIDDYLLLAKRLRERGYRGHVTCGGHVPTFCHRELLRDAPELDSAVRHDGEETLVQVLAALGRGDPVRDIPGLVWRDDGEISAGPVRPPVRDLDRLPIPQRGTVPYCVAGVPIAFLITARGCVGDCNYCSIRAYGRDAGGPPYRMRDPAAIAAEVATLRLQGGVRVCFVQDDLFILPSEKQTVSRIRAITGALRQEGVNDVAFWIKGRPESITPAVLQAAREMGAIHLFLGVESACAPRLEYLGRVHQPEDNERAIALCSEYGIYPSFNLMLFDPDCALPEIAETVRFAARHVGLPWNVCRTEIYSGTRLFERLTAQGRLEGTSRSYGYRMRDPRCELMFRVLRVCLHEHAFAFDSLLNRLVSLSFARQLHQHLFPGRESDAIAAEVQALLAESRRDTVATLERALAFAEGADLADDRAARAFALDEGMALGRRDLLRHSHAERIWEHLHTRGRLLMQLA